MLATPLLFREVRTLSFTTIRSHKQEGKKGREQESNKPLVFLATVEKQAELTNVREALCSEMLPSHIHSVYLHPTQINHMFTSAQRITT